MRDDAGSDDVGNNDVENDDKTSMSIEREDADEAGGTGGTDEIDGADAELTNTTESSEELTHTTESGDVQMVNVGDKPDTARRAVTRGEIHLQSSTVDAIRDDEVAKGDVLATARIGAIQAVKHTWETIPMCHQIPITNVDTEFEVGDNTVQLTVAVETTGKTGCEMEALEGVTTGLNVVWDMVKAAEKNADGQYPDTGIKDIRVCEKEKRTLE